LIALAAVIAALALATGVGAWFRSESVPVTFINDTPQPVIVPDCGSDLTELRPGQTAVLSVSSFSRRCSVDAQRGGAEKAVGCLNLPRPLAAKTVVRLSEASRVSRAHPCK
jgi:hypothetical protein